MTQIAHHEQSYATMTQGVNSLTKPHDLFWQYQEQLFCPLHPTRKRKPCQIQKQNPVPLFSHLTKVLLMQGMRRFHRLRKTS